MSLKMSYGKLPKILLWGLLMSTVTASQHPNRVLLGPEGPRLLQAPAGHSVRLRCGRDYGETLRLHTFTWRFKHCSSDSEPCSNVTALPDSSWAPRCGGRATRGCRRTLSLLHPTQQDSGLYHCDAVPRDGGPPISSTIELEVIGLGTEAPQLLGDLPSNLTVPLGATAVFQCRVLSREPPTILWFRKQDHPEYGDVQYLCGNYKPLNASGMLPLPDDVYLSKLILSNTSGLDAGSYTCLALNYGGFNLQEASLAIVGGSPGEGRAASRIPLWLLFLIPAMLVLLPVAIWLACLYRQPRATSRLPMRAAPVPDKGYQHVV